MSFIPGWNPNVRLAGLTDEQLQQLAVTTGINYAMLKAQQKAELANMGSQGELENDTTIVPTVEVQLTTNPKNPRKARKKK